MATVLVMIVLASGCQLTAPTTFQSSGAPVGNPHQEPLADGAIGWVNKPIIYSYDSPGEINPGRATRAFADKNIFGGPQVFSVASTWHDWYEVELPVRPNGTTGWVHRNDLDYYMTEFYVHVDVSARTAAVYNGTEQLFVSPVVVGKGSTPTPVGKYYVNVNLKRTDDTGAYGPYILGLSGFSEILQSFNGGEPTIGMHGTNKPELLGTAASNGCIRFPNDAITYMHQTLPLGTPVYVTA